MVVEHLSFCKIVFTKQLTDNVDDITIFSMCDAERLVLISVQRILFRIRKCLKQYLGVFAPTKICRDTFASYQIFNAAFVAFWGIHGGENSTSTFMWDYHNRHTDINVGVLNYDPFSCWKAKFFNDLCVCVVFRHQWQCGKNTLLCDVARYDGYDLTSQNSCDYTHCFLFHLELFAENTPCTNSYLKTTKNCRLQPIVTWFRLLAHLLFVILSTTSER